jgi:hypothetical protein
MLWSRVLLLNPRGRALGETGDGVIDLAVEFHGHGIALALEC